MKKTNFFKLLMVGAAALTLGLTSCDFVKESEFQDYCEKVDAMQLTLNELKSKVDGIGDYVVSVVPKAGESGVWVVTPKNGSPLEIKAGGPGDLPQGVLSISADGNWQIGGVNVTDAEGNAIKANALLPRIVNGENNQRWWEFPVIDGTKVVYKKVAAGAASYAVKHANGGWSLWMPTSDKPDELSEILIAGAESGIAKIDILGWIEGKGDEDESISRFQESTDPEAVNNFITDAFTVNYAWIDKFEIDGDNTAATSATLTSPWKINGTEVTTWSYVETVKKLNVLNTLKAERKGILIQVHPATIPVKDLVFELQSSTDNVLPLVVEPGTPELITGLLTRAASESALWFIPFTFNGKEWADNKKGRAHTWSNEEETDTARAYHKEYSDHYYMDTDDITELDQVALYSLAIGERRSEYAYFPIKANPVYSFEAAITAVVNGEEEAEFGDWNAGTIEDAFRVVRGKDYAIEFDETIDPLNIEERTDMVVDYYMEVLDNNDYVPSNFNVTFSKIDGKYTFRVNRLPDELTWAAFTMRVYKLGVDGTVFIEDIDIYPVRDSEPGIIRDARYLVIDEDTRATDDDYLSAPDARRSLQPMFAKLTEPSGLGMTLAERWQNQTHGAKKWDIASIKVGDKYVTGATGGYGFNGGTPDIETFLEGWQFWFLKNDAAIGTNNQNLGGAVSYTNGGVTATGLFDARFFQFQPPYAVDVASSGDPVLIPMFEIGETYEFTFDFSDANGNYISSAVVKLVPELPLLEDLFQKETKYWDGKTLNAYYRTPTNHWPATGDPAAYTTPAYFYDDDHNGTGTDIVWANTPATPGSTFYNIYVPQAGQVNHLPNTPYDAGYKTFGNSTPTSQQWLDATSHIAFRESDDDLFAWEDDDDMFIAGARVGAILDADEWDVYNTGAIVELYNQTPFNENDDDLYEVPIPMEIHPGLYLSVYDYVTIADEDGNDVEKEIFAELGKLEFDLKIMSALEQGWIRPKQGNALNYSYIGGGVFNLNEDYFDCANYSGAEPYSLFTDADGRYNYNYVYRVEFFMPIGDDYEDYNFNSDYIFVKPNGDQIDGANKTVATQINPAENDPNGQTKPYVSLKISNSTQDHDTYLGVRVIDRFGKVKEQVIKIAVNVP